MLALALTAGSVAAAQDAGASQGAAAKRSGVSVAIIRNGPACCGGRQQSGPENPKPRPYQGPPIPTQNADRCDWLDPSVCLYPFPNDRFTVPDPTSDSGRRVNFNLQSMPRNRAGKPVE